MTVVDAREVTILVVTERSGTPAFVSQLARHGGYRPAGLVQSLAEAASVTRSRAPDVVVVDVTSHERLHELAQLPRAPWLRKVVVVSGLPTEVALLTAFVAGARGYVGKPVEQAGVQQAVSAVAAGRMYVDPRCTGWLVELALCGHRSRPTSGLTLRQLQVLRLVRGGLTNRQIAHALDVSVETVKTHLQEAMRRLGAHDRWGATRLVESDEEQ